tara:strand:+ start:53909 stop:55219 length:1311 start_codon:yes stop_codon:yes gene_type:complete
MPRKKVLIITYYWPPSGGSGVQRWLKFSKYLRDFGWEPIIFKPEKAEYPELDHSLSRDVPNNIEVINSPIWEPYQLYKKFTGRDKNQKVQAGFINEDKEPGKLEKIAIWLRGNIFIPDARRFWIRPGTKKLNNWLQHNSVDAIVSTGPPHSTHLIAMNASQKNNIPWLADFRDPWTQIDFYDKLMLTKRSDRKHKRLEKRVLQKASQVVTVSPAWAEDLEQIGGRKVNVITNGFDTSDFVDLEDYDYQKFSITHLGSMNQDRNPETLWKALSSICEEQEGFRDNLQIKLIGKTDHSVFKSIEENGLTQNLVNFKYLPHSEAINEAKKSAVLLLALNNTPNVQGIIPGKLFEYLALERPILCTGNIEGDSAKILTKTESGTAVGFEDFKATKDQIEKWYKGFIDKKLQGSGLSKNQFSRRSLTEGISLLLNEMTEEK